MVKQPTAWRGEESARAETHTPQCSTVDDGIALLPENFTGLEDWDDWVSHFESISAVHGWNDSEKLLWMRVKLVDKAGIAFIQLPLVTKESYELTKTALRNRFEHPSKRELYKLEFLNRVKGEMESWADYGDDLRLLAGKAYPDLQANAQEHLALRYYLDQLKSPLIAVGVKRSHPTTVAEAVSVTLELESYLPRHPPTQRQIEEREEGPLLKAIQSTQQGMIEQVQCLVDQVEKLENFVKKSPRDLPPPRVSRQHHQENVCAMCHQCGNHVSGSPANMKTLCEQEGKSNTARELPTITINSVSSYFLPGCVFETDISCLVDTGAGVSLLNGDVWDKVGPGSIVLEPVHQKLVGVDGISLKVRGASTSP